MIKQSLIVLALASASLSAQAVSVPAISMTVNGGSFTIGSTPGSPDPWTSFSISSNMIGNTDVEYGSPFYLLSSSSPADIFNNSTGAYAPYGGTAAAGGDPISASMNLAAGTLSVDLSGWTVYWNDSNFNQGSTAATGTLSNCSGNTCNYSIAWTNMQAGGPFPGQTGSWTLTGSITASAPVPEASTWGMMLAGLSVIGAALRRRSATKSA
jgi:PEP-CTERM motif